MKIKLALFFIFLSCRLFGQSQAENFKTALMKTKTGAEVVYSSDKHSFTFDIVADSIKTYQQPGYLLVDKILLQYILIANSALKASDSTDDKQKAQLLGYMQYELDYTKNELKIDYINPQSRWAMFNNHIFLLWYYDMPPNSDPKATVLKQVHLSTMCFAHVLNLTIPLTVGDDPQKNIELITQTAKTLKLNAHPIDFDQLYYELKKQ